jgi:hypothetical protein
MMCLLSDLTPEGPNDTLNGRKDLLVAQIQDLDIGSLGRQEIVELLQQTLNEEAACDAPARFVVAGHRLRVIGAARRPS